ncbi:UPF0565 protein [Tanacetum coccineum]
MDRWRGILKVPLFPGSRGHYNVAASLCISTSSQSPTLAPLKLYAPLVLTYHMNNACEVRSICKITMRYFSDSLVCSVNYLELIEYHLVVQSVMDRWRGILKVPLFPGSRGHYNVAASLCISTSSQSPTLAPLELHDPSVLTYQMNNACEVRSICKITMRFFSDSLVPSMNAIFFNGDRVKGTGNPVIERLSDLERIAEVIVSKLGENVNAWVYLLIYKDFIPSVNKWGEPNSYDPTGFPASSSTVSLLSNCLKEVENILSTRLEEPSLSEAARGSCFSQPKTILFGFSKGGSVLNQLVTELAFSEIKPAISSQDKNEIIPTSKESLLNSITEIHYVDVGLNSNGAYITDQEIITRVSKLISERPLGIRFVLHGTPRQWRDSMRVWIGKEKDTMVHLLDTESHKSEGKLSVCERFYFANKLANMQMHFEVIENMDIS